MRADEDAATAAWWQAFLAGLAALGLGATLFYNHRALAIARAAVDETRRIGEAQARCYPVVAAVWMRLFPDGLMALRLQLRNHGASPASEVKVSYLIKVRQIGAGSIQDIAGEFANGRTYYIASGQDIMLDDEVCSEGFNVEVRGLLTCAGDSILVDINIFTEWMDVFQKRGSSLDKYALPFDNRPFDEFISLPSDQRMVSQIVSEINRRRHLGEWTD